mgnify:CR=1 FL=1
MNFKPSGIKPLCVIFGNKNYDSYQKDIAIITTKLNLMELHYGLMLNFGLEKADFYFNKLLQIPFMVIMRLCSLDCKALVEIFMDKSVKYRNISEILSFFIQKAEDIQEGGSEYVASKRWLNIWWPSDEIMYIKICYQNLDVFYEEAEMAIMDFLLEKEIRL